MIDEVSFLRAKLEVRNIAILFCEVLKKLQRAAAIGKQAGKGEFSLRTGGIRRGDRLRLIHDSHCVSDLKRNRRARQTKFEQEPNSKQNKYKITHVTRIRTSILLPAARKLL